MPHPEADSAPVVTVADPITEIAYAKVNLALHVRRRRDDGYHELESLFVFAEDGDRLSGFATDDGMIALSVDGPFGAGLGNGAGNLVSEAATKLQAFLGERRGAKLHLFKSLPVASGIGGGSADAAAALRLLVRLWDASVDQIVLERLALELGSDVPACLRSVTQRVTGRGEGLEACAIEGLSERPMLLVNPGVAVPTGPVFAVWDRKDRGALVAERFDELVEMGRNDLENPAIALAPVISDVLARLRSQAGVRLARMSGSGATCFALFDDAAQRDAATTNIRAAHPDWWTMATRIKG